MCMVGFLLCIVITLPSGREALYRQWAHIYFWALTDSSFVWRAARIIQGPSIGAFQLALKWKLAMFMNNPSANWWSAKMINRLGIDCLLHKTISLALLSTGFSPEQTLNIYQHGTAGAQPEWLSWDGTENIPTRCSFTPSSNAPSASNIHHPPTERSVSCWQAFWERIEPNCLLVYSQVLPVPLLWRPACFCECLTLIRRVWAWMGLRNPCRDLDATVWRHEGVVADFAVRFYVTFFWSPLHESCMPQAFVGGKIQSYLESYSLSLFGSL